MTRSKPVLDDPFSYLNCHLHVSHEAYERLSLYHRLLIKWQSHINLVSTSTLEDVWRRHFLDSLQLLPLIPERSKIIFDLGSGAGFPGMVLAIMGCNHVHLIESDSRKIIFLHEVARLTKTDITIYHGRIENMRAPIPDIIIARACASVDTLLEISSQIISCEMTCLFPKGKNYSKELGDAKKYWSFHCDVIKSITDPEGVILRLTNIRRRGEHDRPGKPQKP